MQDNAPIHKSKSSIRWFNHREIDLLTWPPQSPDLNLIENVWGILARMVYEGGCQFYSKAELKKAILSAWNRIEMKYLQNLVSSMPNRIFNVIRLNGAKAHY